MVVAKKEHVLQINNALNPASQPQLESLRYIDF